MLDAIKQMAADFLGITLKEVRETREALHAEVATEDGRYAARTQLTHPEGSSTPLNEAADSTQQAFAKAREKLEAALPGVMKLFIAYEVALQRRDEASAARDKHWDAEMTRRASGVHPKVDEHFRRLFEHGVTPHNLAQHRGEDVAIVADLHRWKAEDPLYKHPDNPWRGVYAFYADRKIAMPGGGRTVKRSVIGTPVRTRRYAADKWYMFNEIAAGLTGAPIPIVASVPVAPPLPAAPVVAPEKPTPIKAAPTEEVISPSASNGQVTSPESPTAPAAADRQVAVENALMPEPMSAEEHAREMAIATFDMPPFKLGGYWPNGVEVGDYAPEKLIPALELWLASGQAWRGVEEFLAAVREGRAREFIEGRRASRITSLAKQLLAGDERAIAEARAAGCRIELLAASPHRY